MVSWSLPSNSTLLILSGGCICRLQASGPLRPGLAVQDRHGLPSTVHTYTALLQAVAAGQSRDMPFHERRPAAAHLVGPLYCHCISAGPALHQACTV